MNPRAPSLDDLRRKLVKFVNAEDGTTRTVNVMKATSGAEVLERALRKFGKTGTGSAPFLDEENHNGGKYEGSLCIDGWGVFAEDLLGEESKPILNHITELLELIKLKVGPMTEGDLFDICASLQNGAAIQRDALILRQTSESQKRKDMRFYLGNMPVLPTPVNLPISFYSPHSGQFERNSALQHTAQHQPLLSKNRSRASMMSIMSGLGVSHPDIKQPTHDSVQSPTSVTRSSSKKKSMYNFFGHRPPSELISSHLADYFPSAKKRDVAKVRGSMLRLNIAHTAEHDPRSVKSLGMIETDDMPFSSTEQSLTEQGGHYFDPSTCQPADTSSRGHVDHIITDHAGNSKGYYRLPCDEKASPTVKTQELHSANSANSILRACPPNLPPTYQSARLTDLHSDSTFSQLQLLRHSSSLSFKQPSSSHRRTVDEITAEMQHRQTSLSSNRPTSTIDSDISGPPCDSETSPDHTSDVSDVSESSSEYWDDQSSVSSKDSDHNTVEHTRAFTSNGCKF